MSCCGSALALSHEGIQYGEADQTDAIEGG